MSKPTGLTPKVCDVTKPNLLTLMPTRKIFKYFMQERDPPPHSTKKTYWRLEKNHSHFTPDLYLNKLFSYLTFVVSLSFPTSNIIGLSHVSLTMFTETSDHLWVSHYMIINGQLTIKSPLSLSTLSDSSLSTSTYVYISKN